MNTCEYCNDKVKGNLNYSYMLKKNKTIWVCNYCNVFEVEKRIESFRTHRLKHIK